MLRNSLFLFLISLAPFFAQAQKSNGYEISIQINGFSEKEIYMAYHLGEKQYIKDTLRQQSNGSFLFKGIHPSNQASIWLFYLQTIIISS